MAERKADPLRAAYASMKTCWKAESSWRGRLQKWIAKQNKLACNHDPISIDVDGDGVFCLQCRHEEEWDEMNAEEKADAR